MALFFFLIFAILGVSLFDGSTYYRCRYEPSPFTNGTWPIVEDATYLCDPLATSRTCPNNYYCGSLLDLYYGCKYNDSNLCPYFDITNELIVSNIF